MHLGPKAYQHLVNMKVLLVFTALLVGTFSEQLFVG